METVNKYTELLKICGDRQINAQDFINGRLYTKSEGWAYVEISEDLRDQFASEVSDLLGGWTKTKEAIRYTLVNGRPQHWGLGRILLENYSGKIGWSYCAGQDYAYETQQIRNNLK